MQTALDERDNLLQDTFQILEELRTSILGDEKSSGRTQLDERYSTLWGELYNLNDDPQELHNIYGQPGTEKITQKLMKELVKLQQQYDDKAALQLNDMQ